MIRSDKSAHFLGTRRGVFLFELLMKIKIVKKSYINRYTQYIHKINSGYSLHQIKYNLGDFPYEFYDENMGPSGEMVTAFEKAIFSEGIIVRTADRDISGSYVLRTTKERLENKYKIIISIR